MIEPREQADALHQQRTLARFGELALRSGSLEEILHEACRLVGEALGTDLSKVLELQEDGHSLLVKAGVGWKPGVVGRVRINAKESSSEGHALRTGEPVVSSDTREETRFELPAFLTDNGVRALVNVVILGPEGEPPYGVLEVDSREPRQFDDDDIAFLRGYANLLAAAVARLRVLDEVRRSEAFARGILAASPDCVKVLDANATLCFMNERGLALNEIDDPATVLGRNYLDIWPAESRAALETAIARAVAGDTARVEGFCSTAKGNPRWWEVRFAPLPGPAGEPTRVVGISRDVSERRQAEAARFESEERLRAIFDTVPVGIIVAEAPSGRITACNATAERIFRHPMLPSPDIESYRAWVSFHPDGRRVQPNEYPLARALRGEEQPRLEVQYQFDDGSRGWVLLSAAPLRDAAGAITGAIVTAQDIELQKRAAEVLERSRAALEVEVEVRTRDLDATQRNLVVEMGGRQAAEGLVRQLQKMEAIGQLTGGIAHDFNNMLAVVTSALTLVQRRLSRGNADIGKLIDAAMDGAMRAGALTQRLLAFSRKQALAPRPLDANRMVNDMAELLRRTIGERVRLETVLAGSLWLTHADASQLENAVLNLAVNARDAMTTGGRLTIETANTRLDDSYARDNADVVPGQYVMVAVSDTGLGMPPDVIYRVFDPFFTTKEVGKGTGLGLSQVYGFVKQSGGHVKIYSEPGLGTSVKVYLPRFYGTGDAQVRAAPSAAPRGGSRQEVILVVEDDDRVRDLTVATLRELNYTVIHAGHASAALRQLDAHPEITLLFTDVVMPDMNGRELAGEAQRRRPDLRVLFTTGYARDAVIHNGILDPDVQLLPKPFNLDQLALKVREVLGLPRE